MTFLRKVQTSNLFYRKFIFWIIIIILAIMSGILFFKNSENRLQNIKKDNFLENSKVSDFSKKIREFWPENIEQQIKEEISNIKDILNIINKEVEQGQEK